MPDAMPKMRAFRPASFMTGPPGLPTRRRRGRQEHGGSSGSSVGERSPSSGLRAAMRAGRHHP